jgi:hypothetical protein
MLAGMLDPVVAIRTLLLREALPDVALRPGTVVVARVASRGEAHGVLVLAGVPLKAALPDEVQAGATLRLRVDDVSPERVILRLEGAPPPPPAAAAPAPPPRPEARVAVREPPRRRMEAGEEVASVALAFTSPTLGRLDLRIDLAAGRVEATVDARPGDPHDRAVAAAERLRAILADRTARPATVRVRPRHDPVDLYA